MKYLRIGVFSWVFLLLGNIASSSAAEGMSDAELQEAILKIQKVQILDRPCILVGMGLTQLMNDDYYIGAFYMDELADRATEEDLIEIQTPRRMEFKFVSDRRVPASSFRRQIVQALKINNSKDDVAAQKEKIKEFLKLFKGSYKKGDSITIDYHPSFGTRLAKNGRIVGEVAGGGNLFPMLVRMWVGKRPPSSVFKNSLMGRSETSKIIELQKRFVMIKR